VTAADEARRLAALIVERYGDVADLIEERHG
jgi:hypothetical protein